MKFELYSEITIPTFFGAKADDILLMRRLETEVQFFGYFFQKYFVFYEFNFSYFFASNHSDIFYMNQVSKMHLRDKMYLSQKIKMRRMLMDGMQRTWNALRNKSKIRLFFLNVLFVEQFQIQLDPTRLCMLQRIFSKKIFFLKICIR